MLTAIKGKQVGTCIIRSSFNEPQSARLVTKRGSLSDEQLKSALRVVGSGDIIASGLLGGAIVGIPMYLFLVRHQIDVGLLLFGTAVSLGGGMIIGTAYRAVRGMSQGEKWEDIFIGRTYQLRRLLSDKEEWQVTDKKMHKMLERIGDIYPDYPGQCDHIDVENKTGDEGGAMDEAA